MHVCPNNYTIHYTYDKTITNSIFLVPFNYFFQIKNSKMSSFPVLATRSNLGLHIFENTNQKQNLSFFDAKFHDPIDDKSMHRCMAFSPDGKYLAFVNELTGVQIYDVAKNQIFFTIDLPRTKELQWSPKSKYLCLYQPNYAAKKGDDQAKNNGPQPNVTVWDIESKTKINELLNKGAYNGFIWCPKNDSWYGRLSTDGKQVLFFEPEKGGQVVHRWQSADGAPVKAFAVGDGLSRNGKHDQDPLIAFFTPEYKANPAKVRIHRYPDLNSNASLASKSFFKGFLGYKFN